MNGKLTSIANVTVTVPSYSSWSTRRLLDCIEKCIGNISISREQTSREMRERLLPALLELRKRTYRKSPGFYQTLEKIGLKSATVRQWFYRSQAADDIIGMLEQAPAVPREREIPDNAEELLLNHAWNLALAVLRNQLGSSRKLAREFLEAMQERCPFSGAVADQLRRAEQKIPMFTIQEGA